MTIQVKVKFLGAAGTVTGSKHLLLTPNLNLLIDCGLFQGVKALRELNWKSLNVDVTRIHVVILTHAHLDHCGYLPLLYKQGFRGSIYMTEPTADLAEIILRDSAKIQEEDAENANRYSYSKHSPALPLYTEEDVINVLPLFKIVEPNQWKVLLPELQFRFRKNGHILGATFVEIDCFGRRLVFSGDVGRGGDGSITLHAPEKPEKADFLFMESTYGNRLHPATNVEDEMAAIINDTVHNNGTLLIPSFAVGRAQELMVLINRIKEQNKIPDIPVYLDTPMGERATQVMQKYSDWHKLNPEECAGMFKNVRHIKTIKETYELIENRQRKIVIAASGMMTGGRVLHYLKDYLGNRHNTILIVGFQSEGTRGRALQDRRHEIKIHGKYYPVKSCVAEIQALSAHADQNELVQWVDKLPPTSVKVFLVHGEPDAANCLRVKLNDVYGWNVQIPKFEEEVILWQVE